MTRIGIATTPTPPSIYPIKTPYGNGVPTWTLDAAANDSDKSFTVPAGKVWWLQAVLMDCVCSATVGNRLFWCSISDGANVIFSCPQTSNTAAGQTGCLRFYVGSAFTTTASNARTLAGGAVGILMQGPLPAELLLPAGYVIRVYDTAAIDAAADDMTVSLHYVEYTV